jgi:hypothetical protein
MRNFEALPNQGQRMIVETPIAAGWEPNRKGTNAWMIHEIAADKAVFIA